MGDKTQLMTIALAADEAVKYGSIGIIDKAIHILPVWVGTTTGMIIADGFGIIVGIVLNKHIPEKLVKWGSALCFAGFGLLGMHDSLDELLAQSVTIHHYFLLLGVTIIPLGMRKIAKLTEQKLK